MVTPMIDASRVQPAPRIYRVLRPFEGDGAHMHHPGEIVDAAGWKHAKALERYRMIEPVVLVDTDQTPPSASRRAGR